MGTDHQSATQESERPQSARSLVTLTLHTLIIVFYVGVLSGPRVEAQITDGGEGRESSESCDNCLPDTDCAGIPNGNTQMTDCGCGKPASSTFICKACGDNTSCLDCSGVPFGPEKWSGPSNGVPGTERCTKVCPADSVFVAAQNRCINCSDIDANLMKVRYSYYHPTSNPTDNTIDAFRSVNKDGTRVAIRTFAGLTLASSCLAEAVDSCLQEAPGRKNKAEREALRVKKEAEAAVLATNLKESDKKIQELSASMDELNGKIQGLFTQLTQLNRNMATLPKDALKTAQSARADAQKLLDSEKKRKADTQRLLDAEKKRNTNVQEKLRATRKEAAGLDSARQFLMTAVRHIGNNADGDTCVAGIVYGWLAGLVSPAEKAELTKKLSAINAKVTAIQNELNPLKDAVRRLMGDLSTRIRKVTTAQRKLVHAKTPSAQESAQQELDTALAASASASTSLKDAEDSVARKEAELDAVLLERANLASSTGFAGDTGMQNRTDLFGAATTDVRQVSGYVSRSSTGGCGPVDPLLLKIREQLQCNIQDISVSRFDSPVSLLWSPEVSIESVSSFAAFPLDGKSDEKKLFQWRASGMTPLVVYDSAGLGKITDASQLFGSHTFGKDWKDGYEALAALDIDKNGWLEGYELNAVALWFDFNQDGVSQTGEVKRLADTGVYAIGVKADRVDEKTKNIFASNGFKRRVNGKETIGGSVDWFSGVVKGPMPEKPGDAAGAGSKASSATFPANKALATQADFDIVDPTTTVSGIWQWQITDDDSLLPEQRPGGILAFTQEGEALRGQSLSAVEFRPNAYNIHEQISASSLSGSFGDGQLRFAVQGAKGPKGLSTAQLSADGMTLTGTTTEEVALNGATAKVTFAWEARRLVRAN